MIAKREGKIINICSMMSELGRETVSAYAAAKGALKMLTRNIASEYGEYNIQCNGMGPGYIATAQTAPCARSSPMAAAIPSIPSSAPRPPQAAGATPRTWSAPACSWPPMLPTLSTARSCTLMAASWLTSAPAQVSKAPRIEKTLSVIAAQCRLPFLKCGVALPTKLGSCSHVTFHTF